MATYDTIPLMSLEEAISASHPAIPEKPGIYLLLRDREIVYVGRSIRTKDRVRSHIQGGRIKFDHWVFVPCEEARQALLEARYIDKFTPRYNRTNPLASLLGGPTELNVGVRYSGIQEVKSTRDERRENYRRVSEATTRWSLATPIIPLSKEERAMLGYPLMQEATENGI